MVSFLCLGLTSVPLTKARALSSEPTAITTALSSPPIEKGLDHVDMPTQC